MTTIDAALVRRLIASQFPRWAALPVEPVRPDGHDNRTFRLGAEMSVRLPSAARYAAKVEKEQRLLPRLAPHLPLAIPAPLAMGAPGEGYPWAWSVRRWIEGATADVARIDDLAAFATSLGAFLAELRSIDATGGPPPGPHNFFRGGPPSTYDAETRDAIVALRGRIDADAATATWEAALAATWRGAPVWIHGDVAATNLLVRDGRLAAVIDFGGMGVGDPACDLTIAWTFFRGGARTAFRDAAALDEAAWARARGWALWKALITVAGRCDADAAQTAAARAVIDDVIVEAA